MPRTLPAHCAFDVHWTHLFAGLQTVLLASVHAVRFGGAGARHWTQLPATQAGASCVGHLADAPAIPKSPLQATHVPVARLQTGLPPTHADVLLALHSAHLFVALSQTFFGAMQRVVSPFAPFVHSTQAPEILQAGASGSGHACVAPGVPLLPLHGTHIPVLLQTGVLPPQSAADLQATQLVPTQNGSGVPTHAESPFAWFVRHSTHVPPGPHFGVEPPQSAFVAHVFVHMWPTQNGLPTTAGGWQSAAELQFTHVCEPSSQTGFGAVQFVAFAVLQISHEPATQAGRASVGHSGLTPLPLSPPHATHWLPTHTGFPADLQSFDVRQSTHLLFIVSQT
jgi:hypothetical protein